MKEKLVEEWLIRTGERGGIDQAFGQWLVSEGHEILWLGHSRIEFGKDILSIAPDGSFHAFQIKDEDLNLAEFRRITPQVTELIEVPPVHPRIPPGSSHYPHLVTSGLASEEVALQIRARNERLRVKNSPELELLDRRGLIQRFVKMSDSFWPEKPADIRDFFSFYLAVGKGDFDPKRFSLVLCGLLDGGDESAMRKGQRVAAIGLLGNYLLAPFEREADHWSLFRGWTMIAAHIAWFASKSQLATKQWADSYSLAKQAALECLVFLSQEALDERALNPKNWEFDEYTRSRNLLIASAIAMACLLDQTSKLNHSDIINKLLVKLINEKRLVSCGECSVPLLLVIQWYAEFNKMSASVMPYIHGVVAELCERNHCHADDEPFPPPYVSTDEILERLFNHNAPPQRNRRGGASWTLEALVHVLARRAERQFLSDNWASISKLDMLSFQPTEPADLFIWHSTYGVEALTKPEPTQSWKALLRVAYEDKTTLLPELLRKDADFALMFLLAYPHRISPTLVGLLDAKYGNVDGRI